MGIDYKQTRRDDLLNSDPEAAMTISGSHLAEWIIVVQGMVEGGVGWEVVYDASSNPDQPRLQVARILNGLIVDKSPAESIAFSVRLSTHRLPVVKPSLAFPKWERGSL